MQPLASQVAQISEMGIALVNAFESHRAFGAHQVAQMQATLDEAAKTQDEVVIALVYPIEKLLRAN